ncbi:MAG: CGCGG family rSAM-modified RiPP protein [Thermoactinomyces sp.]
MKTCDWSINLEDEWFEQNPAKLFREAVEAARNTAQGYFVNLVVPGSVREPEREFVSDLARCLREENIPVQDICYIDQCGCGGHVIRVYR